MSSNFLPCCMRLLPSVCVHNSPPLYYFCCDQNKNGRFGGVGEEKPCVEVARGVLALEETSLTHLIGADYMLSQPLFFIAGLGLGFPNPALNLIATHV